ncbi:MAG: aminoacyl-tRNA hydrolase [Clostridiales bacterium]|nr:aminoacyl-tRNA hydrolase [Clostridiales bacterium]MDO4350971.1 aminoacyl-tRNA hydrolase [Eubacteriales bacterium]MDY4008892.1 aminoacyl-tRNA hydrolase [Candidatus Limiplasma sp.]
MYLIVGLGNPGPKYAHTRHNVGFDVLDALARKLGVSIAREKENALVGECFIDGKKVVLALPQTYMNLSGEAVARLVNWYKIAPEHLMVAYDDIDLAPGSIRIRKSGSAGTHNGMRSIVGLLGYDTFPRLRVGVGERKPGFELADWVLSRYQQPQEQQAADAAYALAADAIVEYIQNGIESAMCKYNTKKKKPAPSEGAAQ